MEIRVDEEQLVAVAGRLLQVKQALLDGHREDVAEHVFGSGEVAATVSELLGHWSQQHAAIIDAIDRCHRDLITTARAYEEQERAVTEALDTDGR